MERWCCCHPAARSATTFWHGCVPWRRSCRPATCWLTRSRSCLIHSTGSDRLGREVGGAARARVRGPAATTPRSVGGRRHRGDLGGGGSPTYRGGTRGGRSAGAGLVGGHVGGVSRHAQCRVGRVLPWPAAAVPDRD